MDLGDFRVVVGAVEDQFGDLIVIADPETDVLRVFIGVLCHNLLKLFIKCKHIQNTVNGFRLELKEGTGLAKHLLKRIQGLLLAVPGRKPDVDGKEHTEGNGHDRKEKGDFNIPILSSSEDEIGQLTKSFQSMLTKMAILIEDQFKLGHEIKNAELKALQAQINPHFLYNTLDLINWMSMKYNAKEISSLVDALSKFYKLSLSRGEDVISIEDELNHVKAYVMIQNMRFSNGITLETDVSDELKQYGILKILLQPLVENAILHGILEKDDEQGTIRITGWLENGIITLRIQDDGAGMSWEMLQEIPNRILPNEKHGYGIRNIDERIRLNYGSEYGLTYDSKPGEGTTVEIRIPAIHYERANPGARSNEFKSWSV